MTAQDLNLQPQGPAGGDLSGNYPNPVVIGLNGGPVSEYRNLLMNGDMRIDQLNEGASTSLTTGSTFYITDGWKVKLISSAVSATAQQVTDVPAGQGFIDSLKISIASGAAVSAGDQLTIQQSIEGFISQPLGYGAAGAIGLSLSFWVKSSVANETFSFALQNSAANRTYVSTFTVSSAATWTYVTIPNIPGDITGTWLTTNGIGLTLFIVVGSGSTNQTSTLNAWQSASSFAANTQTNDIMTTSSSSFAITGIQIEMGSLSTLFSRIPYWDSLVFCRRYYQKTFNQGTAPAQNAGVAGAITVKNPIANGEPSYWWQFTVPMRANPAIVTFNPSSINANWRDITAASDATVSVDPASSIGTDGVLLATSSTVTTLGDILAIHATANARL